MDLYKTLIKTKYKDQVIKILEANSGDIDGSFLGFTDTYYYLSKLIPKDWVVVDLGCGYGFQSWFFRNHKKYIMINPVQRKEFEVFAPKEWCEFYNMTTEEFLKQWKGDFADTKRKFGICNYVPPWHNQDSGKLVREYFDYCYVFYP
jgi:hypothetical protein